MDETTRRQTIMHLSTYSSTLGSGITTQKQHQEAKNICMDCGEHMQRLQPKAWMPLPKSYEPQESEGECKNCEYYHNPDYTRCHECKAESEDKK